MANWRCRCCRSALPAESGSQAEGSQVLRKLGGMSASLGARTEDRPAARGPRWSVVSVNDTNNTNTHSKTIVNIARIRIIINAKPCSLTPQHSAAECDQLFRGVYIRREVSSESACCDCQMGRICLPNCPVSCAVDPELVGVVISTLLPQCRRFWDVVSKGSRGEVPSLSSEPSYVEELTWAARHAVM